MEKYTFYKSQKKSQLSGIFMNKVPFLHVNPSNPGSHPWSQLPVIWWHAVLFKHFPQMKLQFSPWNPAMHSIKKASTMLKKVISLLKYKCAAKSFKLFINDSVRFYTFLARHSFPTRFTPGITYTCLFITAITVWVTLLPTVDSKKVVITL